MLDDNKSCNIERDMQYNEKDKASLISFIQTSERNYTFGK